MLTVADVWSTRVSLFILSDAVRRWQQCTSESVYGKRVRKRHAQGLARYHDVCVLVGGSWRSSKLEHRSALVAPPLLYSLYYLSKLRPYTTKYVSSCDYICVPHTTMETNKHFSKEGGREGGTERERARESERESSTLSFLLPIHRNYAVSSLGKKNVRQTGELSQE